MLLLLGEGELSNEQQKVCKCKKKNVRRIIASLLSLKDAIIGHLNR